MSDLALWSGVVVILFGLWFSLAEGEEEAGYG